MLLGSPLFAGGKLYVLGGNMGLSNEAVWEGILADAAGGPIGVLGVASGSPSSSEELLVETFEEYAAGSARAIPIRTRTDAESQTFVDQIRACKGFYFTGGDQSRATEILLRADGSDTAALAALREVLSAGGVIAGSSAGAAVMSDPMIAGGTSAGALKNGTASGGVGLDKGLGFYPGVLMDQHFLVRGRLGRLAVATRSAGFRYGFGIDEDTGLVIDLDSRTGKAIGAMGVVVCDVVNASESQDGRLGNVFLHYFETGDSWNFADGQLTVTGKTPLGEGTQAIATITATDVWDDFEVWRLTTTLVDSNAAAHAVGADPVYDVIFQKSRATNAWKGPRHSYENTRFSYSYTGVIMHVMPKGELPPLQAFAGMIVN